MNQRAPDNGGVYAPSRATQAGPSSANTAMTVAQIEAIFRPKGKSAPIDEYINQLHTVSQNWGVNAGVLQQTVSDPAQPTSMAGLIGSNTGDLKWTGAAASDFGTKATATAAYSDQIAKVMPKIQTALSGLAGNLSKSKTMFEPVFDAWGSPGSGSKATVPNALATLLQVSLPAQIIMGYDYKDQEQSNSFSFDYGGATVNAMIYVPAKNMHADPGNPYLASTFDVYSPNKGGSGDYGYSGLVWCSYDKKDGYCQLQKYVLYDSADGNNMVTDKDGSAFTAGFLQRTFQQQYKTHLLDVMTVTGQHFTTARSQFPALPQPDKALKPPTSDGKKPGSPSSVGPGASGLGGGGKIGSPGASGLKTPTMPKTTPTGLTTPPPNTPPTYHLPTPVTPPKGLPGPGGNGSVPGGSDGQLGGTTGLQNPGGGSNGGFPTPTGLPPVAGGLPGYTSTQTAGFDPTQLPTLTSGLPGGGLNGLGGFGGGSPATGLTGTAAGLGGLGGLGGGIGGLGASSGALGGFGGGSSNAGSVSLGTTAAGTPLAAGETAAAQGALGEQAAMAEAGAAGRMPMMPPMAPMGMNGGNGDRNRKSWLPEEEDLWGLAEGSAAPPVIGGEP